MRISDWSSDVCSSDLQGIAPGVPVLACQGLEACPGPRSGIARRRSSTLPAVAHHVPPGSGHDHSNAPMTVPAAHGLGMRRVLLTISVPDSAYTSTSGCSCHGPSCHTPNHRRSEEHTSELQSLMRISYAVFCLKKKTNIQHSIRDHSLT